MLDFVIYFKRKTLTASYPEKGTKMELHQSRIVANHRIKPINPIQCGYHKCAPDHDYGPATRDHWLLHFVVSGKGEFETARGKHRLTAGDMFIIRPYEITYYKADTDHPWEYI